MPSSLFAMKIPKWLRGRPIFTRLLKKLEIRPVSWWQSQCYSIKTRFSNLEKNFELRMVSHKIKQINASLRFTNVVLLCLIKVIKISSGQQKCIYLYRQNCTMMNQNRQITFPWILDLGIIARGVLMGAWRNSIFEDTMIRTTGIGPLHYPKKHRIIVGLFHHALVYWGTTNLKDEYAPKKIVIKIFMGLG